MSNNKQSSIDILCGKLAMKLGIPQAITFYIDHQEEIAEAREMHKEEIEEAHNQGYGSGMIDDQITPKQYYNETFGGGEQ
tara:strand:- start:1613 stop:1852 length:240 start_codon:yes stop_codon:yes gene_type:complete